jgi:phosphoenolpyruvate-protein kinase (PTS system EI component)
MDTEEVDALRELVRTAHESMKDLRSLIREAHVANEMLASRLDLLTDNKIRSVVITGLEKFHKELEVNIADATNKVYARFDTITDILMGEDKASKRRGQKSVVELVKEKKDAGLL